MRDRLRRVLAALHLWARRTGFDEEIALRWLLFGLMAGIIQAHAVQVLAALAGALPWNDKFYVAAAGAVLYSACALLLALAPYIRHPAMRAGLWIAVLGPVAGVLGTGAGAALVAAGVLPGPFRAFDAFQVCAGALQVGALVVAVALIRR